jgi:hypothetical protein
MKWGTAPVGRDPQGAMPLVCNAFLNDDEGFGVGKLTWIVGGSKFSAKLVIMGLQ